MRTALRVLCLGSALLTHPALAYERAVTLDVAVGVSGHAAARNTDDFGALALLGASYGLTDTWSVRGWVSGASAFAPNGRASRHQAASVGGELLYLLDVLSVVPYFGVGVSPYFRFDGTTEITAHVVGGLDYHLTQQHLVGLDLRLHRPMTALVDSAAFMSAVVRYSYLFEL